MSKTDDYKKKANELYWFNQWLSLLGSAYHGGGGGIGRVLNAKFTCEIYHQEYDGARNYHEPDTSFAGLLNEAAKVHASAILQTAKAALEKELAKAATEAAAEANEILNIIKTTSPEQS